MEMSRLEILQKIESGELDVEEGSRLLNDLDAMQSRPSTAAQDGQKPPDAGSDPAGAAVGEVLQPDAGRSVIPDFKGFRK